MAHAERLTGAAQTWRVTDGAGLKLGDVVWTREADAVRVVAGNEANVFRDDDPDLLRKLVSATDVAALSFFWRARQDAEVPWVVHRDDIIVVASFDELTIEEIEARAAHDIAVDAERRIPREHWLEHVRLVYERHSRWRRDSIERIKLERDRRRKRGDSDAVDLEAELADGPLYLRRGWGTKRNSAQHVAALALTELGFGPTEIGRAVKKPDGSALDPAQVRRATNRMREALRRLLALGSSAKS